MADSDFSTGTPEPLPLLSYATPTRPARRGLRIALIIIGCLVGAWVLLVALGYSWIAEHPNLGTDAEDLPVAQIEAFGQFRLPPAATNVRSHLQGFQDHVLRVRFDMPAGQLQAFIAGTLCTLPLSTTRIPVQLAPSGPGDKKWWNPTRPAVFEAGEGSQGNVHQQILIDKTNPAIYTVYVLAFDI